jgi:hypothetical protein
MLRFDKSVIRRPRTVFESWPDAASQCLQGHLEMSDKEYEIYRKIIDSNMELESYQQAIDSHLQWKKMIEHLFEKHDQELMSPSIMGRSDLCPLGRWLDGNNSNETEDLRLMHRRFHDQVKEILSLYQAQEMEKASGKLNLFLATSENVVRLLKDLQAKEKEN